MTMMYLLVLYNQVFPDLLDLPARQDLPAHPDLLVLQEL
jgi:hypothetical protein